MFRYTALSLTLALSCLATEQAPQQPEATPALPGTHQAFIPELLALLSQTEQCLAGCTDAASVEAALPRLRELAAQARQLAVQQQALPEPTVQDYMAAHPHVAEFNKLWEAIGGHISRLEQAGLMSPALRDILQLAPKP